jgi:acyl-ACP thioesterase
MPLHQEISTKDFAVRFSDCDHTSHVRLSSIFKFMEEAAVFDSERNGFGIWKMVQNGYTYAVSRVKLRINHIPVWGEQLTISTWTKEFYNHKVALKDYSIFDAQGNAIAQATSSWLLVNLKTGKAEDPENAPFLPPLFPEHEALSEHLELLEARPDPQVVLSKQARYSDLDMNRHVNNCRYVDWAMDALSLQEIKDHPIRSLQMNYLAQVPFDGKVNIVRFPNTNYHAYVFGVNADNPMQVHFQARIGFC